MKAQALTAACGLHEIRWFCTIIGDWSPSFARATQHRLTMLIGATIPACAGMVSPYLA